MRLPPAATLPALLALPGMALALPVPSEPLTSGLLHPLRGPDHLLVVLAVGLLAGQQEVLVRVSFPLAFLLSMGAGLWLSAAGLRIPMVAPMVLASILMLGALLAFAARPPVEGAAVGAALFGLFHGAAQGAVGRGPAFSLAVLATTAVLLALGAGLGVAIRRLLEGEDGLLALRLLGANLGLAALVLAFS